MPTEDSKPMQARICDGPLAALTQLLNADERHRQTGEALLTDVGACYIRQVIASLRSGSDLPDTLTLPYWDKDQLQLWLGGRVLATLGKRKSYMTMVLAAFQQAGWAKRHVHCPLPRADGESELDAKKRLHSTLKNLNRELPAGTIRFFTEADGEDVGWDFDPSEPAEAPHLKLRSDV